VAALAVSYFGLERAPFHLGRLASRVARLFALQARERGITLETPGAEAAGQP